MREVPYHQPKNSLPTRPFPLIFAHLSTQTAVLHDYDESELQSKPAAAKFSGGDRPFVVRAHAEGT